MASLWIITLSLFFSFFFILFYFCSFLFGYWEDEGRDSKKNRILSHGIKENDGALWLKWKLYHVCVYVSIASTFSIFLCYFFFFFSVFLHLNFLIETKNMYFKQKSNKIINKTFTWESRSIMRSEEILGSMPTLQCLAIALLSSVSIANGGSIPCIASKPKKKTLSYSYPNNHKFQLKKKKRKNWKH